MRIIYFHQHIKAKNTHNLLQNDYKGFQKEVISWAINGPHQMIYMETYFSYENKLHWTTQLFQKKTTEWSRLSHKTRNKASEFKIIRNILSSPSFLRSRKVFFFFFFFKSFGNKKVYGNMPKTRRSRASKVAYFTSNL